MKVKYLSVVYRITDLDETPKFYEDVMGFQRLYELYSEDGNISEIVYRTPDGKRMKLVYSPNEIDNNREDYHIAWDVPSVVDAANYFASKGVTVYHFPPNESVPDVVPADFPFVPKQGPCGCYGLHFADPSGNNLEFHEVTDKSLQFKTLEEIEPLLPKIAKNEYIEGVEY